MNPTLVMKCNTYGDFIGECPYRNSGVECFNCNQCYYEKRYVTVKEEEKEETQNIEHNDDKA